jgi:polyhydroxybutyrate depolymerase
MSDHEQQHRWVAVALVALATVGCGSPSPSAAPAASVVPATSVAASLPPPSPATTSVPSAASPSAPAGSDASGTIATRSGKRTYLLHLPPASTRLQPTPVVIAFHSWPMTTTRMANITHLSAVADAHGFAVLFPQGIGDSWSVPGGLPTPAQQAGVDDVAFVHSLLDAVGPKFRLETSRAVATGISNGGHFAQALGCALADHLAGVVTVAAPLPIGKPRGCKPTRPLSILDIVGTDDQQPSTFEDTLAFWARIDKCPGGAVRSFLPDVAHDRTSVAISTFQDCSKRTEVTGYLITGGGHAWPGGQALGSTEEFGVTTKQFDASELIWTFLSRHV